MKVKQRLTSALLAITAFCTLAQGGVKAEQTGVSESVKAALVNLGIMSESDINSAGYVTRGYAAKAVVGLYKNVPVEAASGTMFIDVTSDTLYASEIEFAAYNKLVYGVGDGLYKPSETITDDNMATILLRYAGYDKINADNQVRSKLLKNVNSADALSYQDLANMLYNTLDLKVPYLDSIGAGGNVYGIDEETTILNQNFDAYKVEGIITENGYTSFFAGSDLREDEVRIKSTKEDIIMQIGKTDIDAMIGRYVTAYFKNDESTDKYVCIGYTVSESRNDVVEISLFDIDYSESTNTKISYVAGEEARTKKLRVSSSAAIIYNGTYYSDAGFSVAQLSGKEGMLAAIDNDSDGESDILVIEAYDVYVIKNVILNDKIVIKNDGTGLAGGISLDEEDYDVFRLYNADGTKGNIEDFESEMVISVAENCASSDKKIIKIILSDETESGTVTGIYTDDLARRVVEIDSEKYYCLGVFNETVTIGQGIRVLLSAKGNIAGLTASAFYENPIGIITKVSYDRRNDAVRVNMILANNKREEFSVKNKIKIDGTTSKDMQTAYNLLQTAAANAKITFTDGSNNYTVEEGVFPVRYRLRNNGEIAELDSPYRDISVESTDTLTYFDAGHYFYESGVMGAKFALHGSAQAFAINANPSSGTIKADWVSDPQYSEMSDVSSLVSRGTYFEYAYKFKDNSMYADFIIIFNPWGAKTHNSDLFMLEKVNTVLDDVSGEETYEITGVSGNTHKTYVVSDLYKEPFETLSSVDALPKRGSVLRLALDDYGKVLNAKIIIELDLDTVPESSKLIGSNVNDGEKSLATLREYAKSNYVVYGYVKEREGNIVKVAYRSPDFTLAGGMDTSGKYDKEKINNSQEMVISIPSSASLIVYDIPEDDIYTGTYDDIYDYKTSGNRCSLVALIFSSARVSSGVIYNYTDLVKP